MRTQATSEAKVLPFLRRHQHGARLGFLVANLLIWSVVIVSADDFASDKTRLEDGLRTGGWAEVIAGTAATIVSVLVNGAEIIRTTTEGEGEEGEEPTLWKFDVRTEGGRTTLATDGEDMLWIYAKILCNKPDMRPDLATKGIDFSVEGTHADWVEMGTPKMSGGMKVVRIKAEPPSPDSELSDEKITIMVSGNLGGSSQQAPVEITLEEELHMEVEVLD